MLSNDFQKVVLKSRQLFCDGVILAAKLRKVASNSESNAWKNNDGKAFFWTVNELFGKREKTVNILRENRRVTGDFCHMKFVQVVLPSH